MSDWRFVLRSRGVGLALSGGSVRGRHQRPDPGRHWAVGDSRDQRRQSGGCGASRRPGLARTDRAGTFDLLAFRSSSAGLSQASLSPGGGGQLGHLRSKRRLSTFTRRCRTWSSKKLLNGRTVDGVTGATGAPCAFLFSRPFDRCTSR
jgi:hypothetical protein